VQKTWEKYNPEPIRIEIELHDRIYTMHISAVNHRILAQPPLFSISISSRFQIKSLLIQALPPTRRPLTMSASTKDQPQLKGAQLTPTEATLAILRSADAFCFDVDSTFCEDESIDEIASFLGVGEQVAALTAQAMGGSVNFREALTQRLGVMKPSRHDMQRFLDLHPHRISPGIPQLLSTLKALNKQVFLVSGGFRAVIEPLAQKLDIPIANVFANTILYNDNDNGAYAGFDTNEFTSRSGGKAEAVVHIKSSKKLKTIVMVGDGATDAEAKSLPGGADLFVGYGGVVVRPSVAASADWFVLKIEDITRALNGDDL